MARLAAQLQGVTIWNEYQVNTEQTNPERRLLAAIISQAIEDLANEIKLGYDLVNPLRVNRVEGGAHLPPRPAMFTSGAFIAPLQWFIESNTDICSFNWICEHLQMDHHALRKAIFMKLGIINFIKLYGLRNICMV